MATPTNYNSSLTLNQLSGTLEIMELPSKRKTLHIKIAVVTFVSILSPIIAGFFIPITPIFSILLGLASAIFAITILFIFLKPLATLVKSTEAITDGNLNHRIDIRSGDEFEDVGEAFNGMLQNLTFSFQKLEKEQQVAISEKNTLNTILSSMVDGVIALDFNKNIVLVNKSAEELTGYSQTEIIGKPIDQAVHVFSDQEEILCKTYCSENYNGVATVIGKMGRKTKIHLGAITVSGNIQTNLSCLLVMHDLSKEAELEQAKFDFVSMASHELRTPLTNIIGYLSVFLNENKDKIAKEEIDLLAKAFISSRQLLTLIQNLLNVNKIERDQMSVSIEPLDYTPILSKTVEDLKGQASQKNIVLNLSLPIEPLPKVLADPIRLTEVVTNLLANAINYTNSGGKVGVTITVSPNEITTTITDTGVGIPKEAIPHLFNKFFRVSNVLQQANKGTGLGLYIAKSIVEKLHGKIWVESEAGKGSKFYFTLPIAQSADEAVHSSKYVHEAIQSGSLNY